MDRVFEDTAPDGRVETPSIGQPEIDIRHAQSLSRSHGDEKNLPTEQSATQKDARLSGAHGHTLGTQRAQAPARQGPPSPDGGNPSQTARLTARPGAGFARRHRLRRRADFLTIQRQGRKRRTSHFLLQMLTEFDSAGPKLGITVSRRIGTAAVRNRLKRRVRECFRLRLRPILPQTAALVVIGLAGAGELNFAAIDQQLTAAVEALARRRES
jgi:ribonuclease P protein component